MVVGRGPQNWLHGAADDTDTGPSQFPNEREAGSDTTTVEDENQRMRSKVVEHALFVLSNLATGDEGVISAVMDSGVPALLPSYLNYSSGDPHSYGAVRFNYTLCILNMWCFASYESRDVGRDVHDHSITFVENHHVRLHWVLSYWWQSSFAVVECSFPFQLLL